MEIKKEKRTYAMRREYLKKAVSDRRRKLKEVVIKEKGGKCFVCGYDRCPGVFDLHHRDARDKEFGLGEKGVTRSLKRVLDEAKKCVLLCANCHREVHLGYISLENRK